MIVAQDDEMFAKGFYKINASDLGKSCTLFSRFSGRRMADEDI